MKQRFLILMMLLAVMVFGPAGAAMAAEDPIRLEMELSKTVFTGPEEVTVTIRVTNTSDADMPGKMGLYYPNGALIEEFGTPILSAGASKTWSGTWMVTQDQIDDGRVIFGMRYTILGDDGQPTRKTESYYVPIESSTTVAQVEIDRYITPTMAGKGQKISVIYEIRNVGTVDVTDVVIKESSTVSKSSGKIDLVKAGEKATYTFTVTMGTKNLTSNARITYKAGSREYTATKEDATIKYGNVKLSATLKADKKGGNPGDTVTLTLTLKNTGKSDYQNVTVTDPQLGTVFSGITVEAGKTVTQEKQLTISQSTSYQFTVTGTDASGTTIETATDKLDVTAVDPTQVVSLSVNVQTDKPILYMLPDVVTFTVNVTNTSAVDAKNVTVSASGVDLYHFDLIPAGQTRTFVRDVRIEMAGNFRFDARVADQLGETVTFMSDLMRISKTSPTATPSQVPMPTPRMPDMEEIPTSDGLPPYVTTLQYALNIGLNVGLIVGGICIVLIVIGLASRAANAAKSSKASDHLERDGYRSYIDAVSPRKRHVMPDDPDAQDDEDEEREEPVIIKKPTPQSEPQSDPAAVADAMAELYPDASKQGEATYQRRRRGED